MTEPKQIDSAWIAANPPPVHDRGTTKNSRGRVLVIGGSTMVPGAVRLTGEAALRAGAGKLQMATVETAVAALGIVVPEAAVIALPISDDGEIAPCTPDRLKTSIEEADVIVLGPGVSSAQVGAHLLSLVTSLAPKQTVLILDAAVISCMRNNVEALSPFRGRLIATPHHGEMAALTELDLEVIAADPAKIANKIAQQYGAIVVLKASDTVIATPQGESLHYGGGGIAWRQAVRAMYWRARLVALPLAEHSQSLLQVGAYGCMGRRGVGLQLIAGPSDSWHANCPRSFRGYYRNRSAVTRTGWVTAGSGCACGPTLRRFTNLRIR